MRNGPSVVLLAITVAERMKVFPEMSPVNREGRGGRPSIGCGPPPPNVTPVAVNTPSTVSVHVPSIAPEPHCNSSAPPARDIIRLACALPHAPLASGATGDAQPSKVNSESRPTSRRMQRSQVRTHWIPVSAAVGHRKSPVPKVCVSNSRRPGAGARPSQGVRDCSGSCKWQRAPRDSPLMRLCFQVVRSTLVREEFRRPGLRLVIGFWRNHCDRSCRSAIAHSFVSGAVRLAAGRHGKHDTIAS